MTKTTKSVRPPGTKNRRSREAHATQAHGVLSQKGSDHSASRRKDLAKLADREMETLGLRTSSDLTSKYLESNVRVIAFYLPQFHPVSDNDSWWGKGFTEWPGVASARTLFGGHYQPHIPADLGFYDLRVPEVRAAQAELAKQYGISGFCYHYYWFSGRRVLERPLAEVVKTGEPDFPFCICWANEPWSRRWDGSEAELLIVQEHEVSIDSDLIIDLLPLFRDRRYITIEGKPLVLIYRVGLLPDPHAVFASWREVARRNGFPDLHICMAETFGLEDPYKFGCDAAVEFPPHKSVSELLNDSIKGLERGYSGNIYDFGSVVMNEVAAAAPAYPRYRCVMPGWDNTPRRGLAGNVFSGNTPELYELWLREMIAFTKREFPPSRRIVFVNAWNEWGEGAHLEPDLRYGRQFLEATRRAVAGLSGWETVLRGARLRLPEAAEVLTEIEAFLRSYDVSLKYLSSKYLEAQTQQLLRRFVRFDDSALAALGIVADGVCYIERINQVSDEREIAVRVSDCLHVVGWCVIQRRSLSASTDGFITLISEQNSECFTSKILGRTPRPDVVEYHGISEEEAHWSGFHSIAGLREVPAGSYRLAVDTVLKEECFRSMSNRVINVSP